MATKKRRTNRELFLDNLRKLSGNEQRLIANNELRSALSWDKEKYDRIKGQLYDENLVIVGRGQGGTVGLADAPGSKALRVFLSYSHADEELKSTLLKHLEPLKRLNLIDAWTDRKLKAGDDWEKDISANLEDADIILLLVSIDFINSKYCYDIELERALELHEANKAIVVPVILRSCLWQHTPFSKLQALPKDARAVWSWPDRDEAFADIAEGIRVLAERIRAR